eukprot:m.240187 g.240187  ORF g.240187 m.240187 type:complete len:1109 (-) comp15302_c0_seq1:713-4039(-)
MRAAETRAADLVAHLSPERFNELSTLLQTHGNSLKVFVTSRLIHSAVSSKFAERPQLTYLKQLVSELQASHIIAPAFAESLDRFSRSSSQAFPRDILLRICDSLKLPEEDRLAIAAFSCQSATSAVRENGAHALLTWVNSVHPARLSASLLMTVVSLMKSPQYPELGQHPGVIAFLADVEELDTRGKPELQVVKQIVAPAGEREAVSRKQQSIERLLQTTSSPSEMSSTLLQMSSNLAGVIADLGFLSVSNPSAAQQLLASMKADINPQVIADALAVMCSRTSGLDTDLSFHSEKQTASWDGEPPRKQAWDVQALVTAINKENPKFDWSATLTAMEGSSYFHITDLAGFALLEQLHAIVLKTAYPPEKLISRDWASPKAQFALISLLLAPANRGEALVQAFWKRHVPSRKLPKDGLKAQGSLSDPTMSAWCSLDVIARLLILSESDMLYAVQDMLKKAFAHNLDALTMALANAFESDATWTMCQDTMLPTLLHGFLDLSTNSAPILQKVLAVQRQVVLNAMLDWFNMQPTQARLDRIFATGRDLKVIDSLLKLPDLSFVLELTVKSASQEFTNVEKLLKNRLRENPVVFSQACVNFLASKLTGTSQTAPISPQNFKTFFDCLSGVAGMLPPPLAKSIASLQSRAAALTQGNSTPLTPPGIPNRMQSAPPGLDTYRPVPPSPQGPHLSGHPHTMSGGPPATSELDSTVDSFFTRFYERRLPAQSFIDQIQMFKRSPHLQQRQVAHKIVSVLFEEAKYYKDYPEAQQHQTGELLGMMVEHRILTDDSLSEAFHLLLHLLTDPTLCNLAAVAISKFKGQLTLPHMHGFVKQLVQLHLTEKMHQTLQRDILAAYQHIITLSQQQQQQQQLQQQVLDQAQWIQHNLQQLRQLQQQQLSQQQQPFSFPQASQAQVQSLAQQVQHQQAIPWQLQQALQFQQLAAGTHGLQGVGALQADPSMLPLAQSDPFAATSLAQLASTRFHAYPAPNPLTADPSVAYHASSQHDARHSHRGRHRKLTQAMSRVRALEAQLASIGIPQEQFHYMRESFTDRDFQEILNERGEDLQGQARVLERNRMYSQHYRKQKKKELQAFLAREEKLTALLQSATQQQSAT